MTEFVFDMETGDPDDIFTLALLATHPRSNLVAVTIHPGGPDQIGLVKHILSLLNKSIPVGIGCPKKVANRVGSFYYDWLGPIPTGYSDGPATEVLRYAVEYYPDAHLVTGAPLTNIAAAKKNSIKFFKTWICQGGFAGANILPPNMVLTKFKDRITCPTYNLGGDTKAARYLLCDDPTPISVRRLVPKSLCHGIFYTPKVDEIIPFGAHEGLDFIKRGMNAYFKKHPNGKALHDIIAAVAALNPEIFSWTSITPYTDKNGWGCTPGGSISIATDVDIPKLETALAM